MKLYRTQYGTEEDELLHCHWSGTQLAARATRKELKDDGRHEVETEEVDVPTNKEGLLDFLNTNCKIIPET